MKRINVTRIEDQSEPKNVMVDMVVDKGIGREGYDPREDLQEFEENGLHGLKTPGGEVVCPAEYDRIMKWPDADVIYTLKGGEYRYFNTAGEEILTDVQPVDGLESGEDLMPWHVTEEQHRPYVIVMRPVDGPVSARCCLFRGQWVELRRIARKDVKKVMKVDTAEFDNEFSYIYAGYEVVASGDKAVIECIGKLSDLGCYQSSWSYLTRILISPEMRNTEFAENTLMFGMVGFDTLSPCDLDDLHRISFGLDDSLKGEEVKVLQIHYFHDRWPLAEEQSFEKSMTDGSFSDMISSRAAALTAIQESSLREKLSDVLWDFPRRKRVPCDMFRNGDPKEMERKLEWLKTAGMSIESAVWDVAVAVRNDIAFLSETTTSGDPQEDWLQRALWEQGVFQGKKPGKKTAYDFGNITELVRWYITNGEDINVMRQMKTPLDVLESVREEYGDRLRKDSLKGLEGLIGEFVALGAERSETLIPKLCDRGFVDTVYTYVNHSEILNRKMKEE